MDGIDYENDVIYQVSKKLRDLGFGEGVVDQSGAYDCVSANDFRPTIFVHFNEVNITIAQSPNKITMSTAEFLESKLESLIL